MGDSLSATRIPHGGNCECELLAAPLGFGLGAISFEYCHSVLQRTGGSSACMEAAGKRLLLPSRGDGATWALRTG